MTKSAAIRVTGGILLLAFLALVTMVAMSPNRFLYDETYFVDYISLLHRYGFTPTFLNSLDAAPGPLSAIVQVAFEPMTHLRPVAMRFVNVLLLATLTSLLAIRLKREANEYWVAGCSVLIVPMTWVVAGMALSEMSAMMFVMLSLYLQLRGLDALGEGRSVLAWFLLSGVCLGIAVWGRQPFLVLAVIPVLIALMDRRLRAPAGVFVGAASAIAIPLFVIWRGLLPPSLNSAPEGFSVIHGLTSFGYAGICFILLGARSRWLPVKVVLGLTGLTFAANAPLSAFALYPAKSMVDRFLAKPAVALYGNLAGSLFLSCGVVFLAVLLRIIWDSRQDLRRLTLNAGLLCITASPIFDAHQYSSRYTAMSLPYLILAAHPWRRWRLETVITAALGCGVGFLSLYGYFFN